MDSRNVVREFGFEAVSVGEISEVFRHILSIRLTLILMVLMNGRKLTAT
jgi:hypothetical protein